MKTPQYLRYCIRKTFIYKWPQNLHGSSLNAKTFIKLGSEVISYKNVQYIVLLNNKPII